MNLKTIVTLCILPLTLWANDTQAIPQMTNTEPQVTEVKTIAEIAKPDSITESEFSGNPAIDSVDAGNIDAPASEIAASPITENAVAATDTESVVQEGSNQNVVDSQKTDEVAIAESEADSTEADDEKEMSQEEADAELAAAMGPADSSATDSSSKLVLDMTKAVIPTESRRIAGPYGIRTYRMHRGVDLGLCHGEDRTIVAAFPGKVKLVRNQGRRRGYGKYVIIDHGNGLTTLYAHLASWKVKIGDELQAGDTVGVGGNTGRSFGAHLHFEMKYNGVYIDPTTVFNFQEGTYLAANTEIEQSQIQAVEDEYQKELSKHRYYKVRRGDCLGKIARKYGISITRLKQLNKIKGNMIRPGQVLRCS